MQAEKQIAHEPKATRQNTLFVVGVILIALLLFAYYFYTWHNANNFRAAMDTCSKPFCDFATFYYPMGEAIFQTKLPLEGFVYSPFIAILLAVFPPLGLDASLHPLGHPASPLRHSLPASLPSPRPGQAAHPTSLRCPRAVFFSHPAQF